MKNNLSAPSEILNKITFLIELIKDKKIEGYDLFDGADSFLNKVLKGNLLNRVLIQTLVRLPINIRPLIGIKKQSNAKIISDLLVTLLMLKKPEKTFDITINDLYNKLFDLKSSKTKLLAWGLPFNFYSRNGAMLKDTPNVITSYYAGNSVFKYYSLKEDNEVYQKLIQLTNFFTQEVGYKEYKEGICFGYYPGNQKPIHNSNILVGSLIAKISTIKNEINLLEIARKAINYSCSKQNEDGSWFYGELPNLKWIDNFHTGYNLEGLFDYINFTGEKEFENFLIKGFNYYLENFFHNGFIPKYYNNRLYPIDSQTIAQTILILTLLSEYDKRATGILNKLIPWVLENFYNEKGYFYFRKYRYYWIRTPYLRWSTTPMLVALSTYIKKFELYE
jgi:hypothetical protein